MQFNNDIQPIIRENSNGTSYTVVRGLNVTSTGHVLDTPLHLCDPHKLITQHRLGDHRLPYRTVDPRMYDTAEIKWYETGILPPPMYMCMIFARKCYLCGEMQSSDDHMRCECTEHHNEGYRFCMDCEPYFRRALYKTLAPIWRLRLESERNRNKTVWVHRTRRDEFGKSDRTNSGRPFRYTLWCVTSWIPRKSMNRHDPNPENHFEEDLLCVEDNFAQEPMSKMVSVMDLFFTNRGSFADPNYDPNVDDPLNQVRHLTLAEKREIMREESAPFE